MANIRQYIGARYVAKIYENTNDPLSAEWQANVNYEPLTVVTYNNGSYMSKKDVSANIGAPSDNAAYWVQTGFYNGQIASLEARVNSINIVLNSHAASIADLEDAVDRIANSVTVEAQNRTNADNALRDDITEVNQAVTNEVYNRTVADNNLQAQIDNIIAPSGEAPSAAEVENARIGWDSYVYSTLGDAIRGQIIKSLKFVGNVRNNNYTTVLADLNTADKNTMYTFNLNSLTYTGPANLPSAVFPWRGYGVLMTIGDVVRIQLFIHSADKVTTITYFRISGDNGVNWQDWTDSGAYKGSVTTSNYTTKLSDANNALANKTYFLNFNFNSTSFTANLPVNTWLGYGLLRTTGEEDGYLIQEFIYINNQNASLTSYMRIGTRNNWQPWRSTASNEITVSSTDNLAQIMIANSGRKCIYNVEAGTHDLFEELKAVYGDDFFDSSTFNYEGLPINHGSIVNLGAKTIVKFDYDGTNPQVVERFSPFKFTESGGELHGGQIYARNCRYAIHDDVYTQPGTSHSLIDGVYIDYLSARHVGIGGGLSQGSRIEVKNCYVDTHTTDGYGVFYHNTAVGQGQSFITIHDNYFTSDIVIEPYGESLLVSKAIVSNNKCHTVRKYNPDPSIYPDNIELVAFNNVTTG